MARIHTKRVRIASAGVGLAAVACCVGCQGTQTQRVAFEHTGVTLSPEPMVVPLASAEPRVDASTALRLAALGIVID